MRGLDRDVAAERGALLETRRHVDRSGPVGCSPNPSGTPPGRWPLAAGATYEHVGRQRISDVAESPTPVDRPRS
jgi:hypothetical protein